MKIKNLVVPVFLLTVSMQVRAMENSIKLDEEIIALVFENLSPPALANAAVASRRWHELSRETLCKKAAPPEILALKNDDETWSNFARRTLILENMIRHLQKLNKQEIDELLAQEAALEELLILHVESILLKTARKLEVDAPVKLLSFLHSYLVIVLNSTVSGYLNEVHRQAFLRHHFRAARDLLKVSFSSLLSETEKTALKKIMKDVGIIFWNTRMDSMRCDVDIYREITAPSHALESKKTDRGQTKTKLKRVCSTFSTLFRNSNADAIEPHQVKKTEQAIFQLAHLLALVHAIPGLKHQFKSTYQVTLKELNGDMNRSYNDIKRQLFSTVWEYEAHNPYLRSLERLVNALDGGH